MLELGLGVVEAAAALRCRSDEHGDEILAGLAESRRMAARHLLDTGWLDNVQRASDHTRREFRNAVATLDHYRKEAD